jgi:hypothetical protein
MRSAISPTSRDMARAYVALLRHGATSTLYNVASGTTRLMRSVLEALVARARVNVRVEIDPALMRPIDTPIVLGDATRLRRETGWRPEIPFDRTLDDLLNYWRGVTVGLSRIAVHPSERIASRTSRWAALLMLQRVKEEQPMKKFTLGVLMTAAIISAGCGATRRVSSTVAPGPSITSTTIQFNDREHGKDAGSAR